MLASRFLTQASRVRTMRCSRPYANSFAVATRPWRSRSFGWWYVPETQSAIGSPKNPEIASLQSMLA